MNSGVVDSREILEFIRNIVEDSSIDDESLEICNRTIDFALKRIDEYGLLKTQLEIVEQTKKLNEWVDVDDRLPSESGMYLVTVDEGYRKHTTEWFYGTSNGEEGWDEDCGYEDIIAWRPLPQPYKRKE